MKHLSDAHLYIRLQVLLTNIGLGWEYMPVTNTPPYFENPYITDKTSFITLGPGLWAQYCKTFTFVKKFNG
jgi:hypothetical protein